MRSQRIAAVLLLVIVAGWSSASRADTDQDSLLVAFHSSKLTIPTHHQRSYSHFVSQQTFGPPGSGQMLGSGSAGGWATYRERLFGPRRIELSRLDYALHGAGAAANTAMFIGAMANSAGLWDERTSWYIVGAAATLGAVLGGTVAVPEEPGARVRFEWEP